MEQDDNILELQHITKRYPGVVANHDVNLNIKRGEVHALVGENGAGKSTLIKMLSGCNIPDEGKILWEGQEYTRMDPKMSRDLGIAIVYQEMCLVDSLTVAENICLGEKEGRLVNYRHYNQVARDAFDKIGINIDPKREVGELTTAEQQLVEIAKSISKGVKLLVLDEPTAAITENEIEGLFRVMATLKEEGVSMIYISHRMDEIFRVSDRITIMRDGETVGTVNTADTNRKELINMMVGRELTETYPPPNYKSDELVLEVENVCGLGDENISLTLHKGEIVGLGGLVGAGRTELAQMIYGTYPKTSGVVKVKGKEIKPKGPRDGIDAGIGIIPEDRKRHGVILMFGIDWNTTISCVRRLSNFIFMQFDKIAECAQTYINKLQIKAPSVSTPVETLSGGNQQKVVVAKAMATESDIFIFDEPTRGIDVMAKQEIYQLMRDLTDDGKSILLISSDMEELIGMSDRVYVLAEGKLAGELEGDDITQVNIMDLITANSTEVEKAG